MGDDGNANATLAHTEKNRTGYHTSTVLPAEPKSENNADLARTMRIYNLPSDKSVRSLTRACSTIVKMSVVGLQQQ